VPAATELRLATRVGSEDDLQSFVELYRGFREEIASERGAVVHLSREAFFEPLEARFMAILRDDRQQALLGTLDAVPVGMAVGRLEDLADSSRLAVIDVLYVEPGAREVGVGESLLAYAVDWARSKGATGLDTTVLPGMRQAKNFLEGCGFAARLLVMHHHLD